MMYYLVYWAQGKGWNKRFTSSDVKQQIDEPDLVRNVCSISNATM